MDIIADPKFKDVLSYGFTFNNGYHIPIVLDAEIGDTIEELPDRYVLHLVEKSSLSDPEDKLPAEVATVFKSHLLTVVIQKRKQRLQTPEEQLEFRNTLKSLLKAPRTLQ